MYIGRVYYYSDDNIHKPIHVPTGNVLLIKKGQPYKHLINKKVFYRNHYPKLIKTINFIIDKNLYY